ncbi:DUF4031 domain-containing protein [Xylanimonas oleitrophica]|uniref:DUF4031 domain-containing protein n=1 Tax=Xylanimonas oleitrophica TaxID=2607479 RepID=A0A2W5Y9U3_9MICO|nr:DUF4031 domain-containing protein [Xylanimonas oleitrophica]PZR55494.1 DUF4031 domain-containing protein [Xylanimonas oleitrophica]
MLLDAPAWPAHGTLWSHLVSDTSLHELRTFARAAGVGDRAFDLDHYDTPADRHAELVAAGAEPVDGRTLVRRLGASGLRVPGHERAGARRDALRTRWQALWQGLWADGRTGTDTTAAAAAVGDDLLERWSEPHRVYHGRLHLAAALDALDTLLAETGTPAAQARTARLAVWFHDAVHEAGRADPGQAPTDTRPSGDGSGDGNDGGSDEERSAALARHLLAPLVATGALTATDVEEVARLVLVTTDHAPDPDDLLGALVSDADLAVLGGTPARYSRYVHQVRAEYGHVPDDLFRTGRAAVLEQLLALPRLFRTPAGHARWATQAQVNLRAELATRA